LKLKAKFERYLSFSRFHRKRTGIFNTGVSQQLGVETKVENNRAMRHIPALLCLLVASIANSPALSTLVWGVSQHVSSCTTGLPLVGPK
jgi:hypothetical protein